MRLLPPGWQYGLEMIQGGVGQTNDLGEFRIANLQEGEYLVIAAEHHRGPIGHNVASARAAAPTHYPGTTERSSAQSISIRPGHTVSDLWFSVVSSPAFTVSGEVVDASGAPVRAMVTLMPTFRLDLPPSTPMTETESDGAFAIGGVLPGTYHVSATALTASGGASFDFVGGTMTVDSSGATIVEHSSSRQATRVTVTDRDVSGLKVVANALSSRHLTT